MSEKQDQITRFISENKKIMILCESDISLGELHDFLLLIKGSVVLRMVKAQDEEEAESEVMKK